MVGCSSGTLPSVFVFASVSASACLSMFHKSAHLVYVRLILVCFYGFFLFLLGFDSHSPRHSILTISLSFILTFFPFHRVTISSSSLFVFLASHPPVSVRGFFCSLSCFASFGSVQNPRPRQTSKKATKTIEKKVCVSLSFSLKIIRFVLVPSHIILFLLLVQLSSWPSRHLKITRWVKSHTCPQIIANKLDEWHFHCFVLKKQRHERSMCQAKT